MEIIDLINLESIVPDLKASSKKQTLQELASFAAKVIPEEQHDILDVLLERERLGTTGVGHGVAIPHGKFTNLDRPYGLFARLDQAVDFESLDDQPVDLVFLLLVPETAGADHLKALAKVSRTLRDSKICEKIRGSESGDAIFAILTSTVQSSHAA